MTSLKMVPCFFTERFMFNRLSYFVIGLILLLLAVIVVPFIGALTPFSDTYELVLGVLLFVVHMGVVYTSAAFLLFDALRQHSCYGLSQHRPILNQVVSAGAIALPVLGVFVHPIFLSCSFYLLAYSFHMHDMAGYKAYIMNGSLFLLYSVLDLSTVLFT